MYRPTALIQFSSKLERLKLTELQQYQSRFVENCPIIPLIKATINEALKLRNQRLKLVLESQLPIIASYPQRAPKFPPLNPAY